MYVKLHINACKKTPVEFIQVKGSFAGLVNLVKPES